MLVIENGRIRAEKIRKDGGVATAAVGTYNITATLNDPNNRLAAN